MGGFLAGVFHERGHDVSVLARGAHLDAIKSGGLRVRHPDGRMTACAITATDTPHELGAQDLIVTTVKAPALSGLLTSCANVLRHGTPVITAMNGVFWWYGEGFAVDGQSPDCTQLDPDGTLAGLVPADQAVGMVIHSTNQVIEPGLIQNRSAQNRFVIGAATPKGAEQIRAMLPSLQAPSTRFELEADLRRTMWIRSLHQAQVPIKSHR